MLKYEIKQEYIRHPTYGYRRIANALDRKGVKTSKRQIRTHGQDGVEGHLSQAQAQQAR